MKKLKHKPTKKVRVLYLAGPMRRCRYMNFLQFDAHKTALQMRGYKVLSPADIDRRHGYDPFKSITRNLPTPEECAIRDIRAIIKADAVAVMPKHGKSKGVKMEKAVARFLGRPVFKI